MVRTPRVADLAKQQEKDFRKITKKTIKPTSPDIEEKYRNEANYPSKQGDKKKPTSVRKISLSSDVDFSSTPPSVHKPDGPKLAVRVAKRSSININRGLLNRTPASLKNRIPVSTTLTHNLKDVKRTSSATRMQKFRPILSKNKMPAAAKSEPMKKIEKETLRRQKFNKIKNNNPSPPPESYFKPEGKVRERPQKSSLVTPRIVVSRVEKFEEELQSLKSSHILEKKPHVRKIRKPKIVKKKPITKTTSPKQENIDKISSDEKVIREIKHNDSFVISARKLQNSARSPRRSKPEVIRLFKRKDTAKGTNDNSLKSCLKKNSDGKPKQSFGKSASKLSIGKRIKRRSQIPRYSREQLVK